MQFVIDLGMLYGTHPRLPLSFVTSVDGEFPSGFWIQVEGCPNGPNWVEVNDAHPDGFLHLGKGWKAFARARRLYREQYLQFEYDGVATLSVKIYDADGGRARCCEESSNEGGGASDDNGSSSDDFGEEASESSEGSPSVKQEEEDSP